MWLRALVIVGFVAALGSGCNQDMQPVPNNSDAAAPAQDAAASGPDGGQQLVDAGPTGDGGIPIDGGVVDGGTPDGGVVDGGVVDGGVVDGGLVDGGVVDGGIADGGIADGSITP